MYLVVLNRNATRIKITFLILFQEISLRQQSTISINSNKMVIREIENTMAGIEIISSSTRNRPTIVLRIIFTLRLIRSLKILSPLNWAKFWMIQQGWCSLRKNSCQNKFPRQKEFQKIWRNNTTRLKMKFSVCCLEVTNLKITMKMLRPSSAKRI